MLAEFNQHVSVYIVRTNMRFSSLQRDSKKVKEMKASPGGPGVKNLPVRAGDIGSVPVQEDPTCCGAARPVSRPHRACALEPGNHNSWSQHTLGAHAPQ